MTYEIEIIEPRAQKLLEELANLNLIKFIQTKRKKTNTAIVLEPKQDSVISKAEFLAEFKESIEWMNAHKRGEVEAPSFEESMAQMRKELVEEGYDVL